MNTFLTVEECANLLKISEHTVYIKCKRGEYKHEKYPIRIYAKQFQLEDSEEEKLQKDIHYIFS